VSLSQQNVWLKAFNLAMQTLVLVGLLESGSPVELVLGYATLIAANALSCAVKIVCGKFPAVTEVLIGTVYDRSLATRTCAASVDSL
jgi:hypothetical protein